MRRVALALTLGFGLILFAVSATRLGIHAAEIRRAESAKERYGHLEDIVATQEVAMAAASDPSVTVGHAQSKDEKDKIEASIAQASRQREIALLELGSHSSREEAEHLDAIYARRTADDQGLEISLALLVAGLFLASTRKAQPLTAGQSMG